jgi:peptidoglycan/LPS O-acetylase OafA/YrhL
MAAGHAAKAFDDGLPRPDKHMPTLDCLRGVAILLVLVYHGLGSVGRQHPPGLTHLEQGALTAADWGFLGVQLFFVLSGFLITGILLDTRRNEDYYRNFYTRRALRILPALLLILAVLASLRRISAVFLAKALLFLANFGMSSTSVKMYAPLWSLSVEEQFYLVWPTVLRGIRPVWGFVFAVALVVLSPVIRLVALHLPHVLSDTVYKPWGLLDFFGGGAALAMLIRSTRARPHLWKLFYALLGVDAVLFVAYQCSFPDGPGMSAMARATFWSPWALLFTAAVLGAFLKPGLAKSRIGRALSFLGYISYSLYLYHPLIASLLEKHWMLRSTGRESVMLQVVVRFLVFLCVSIPLAWMSRSTVEAYFLKLKVKQRRDAVDLPAQM